MEKSINKSKGPLTEGKTMKYLKSFFVFVVLLISLTGCDSMVGLSNIQLEMPGSEIVAIPQHSYEFIVRKSDGSVWYVISDGFSDARKIMLLSSTEKDK